MVVNNKSNTALVYSQTREGIWKGFLWYYIINAMRNLFEYTATNWQIKNGCKSSLVGYVMIKF